MKITPINYSYCTKNNSAKSQNFKGLWAKPSFMIDFDKAVRIPMFKYTSYYYPFSDETAKEIKSIKKRNTKAYFEYDEKNEPNKCIIKELKVCTTLPFSKGDFERYKAVTEDSPLTTKAKIVHYSIKDKYLNNGIEENQNSANNDIVELKLQQEEKISN